MKFKKIMLITLLLLAVLTIGAVSASDDVASEGLAVSDDGDSIESPVDDSDSLSDPDDGGGDAETDDVEFWVDDDNEFYEEDYDDAFCGATIKNGIEGNITLTSGENTLFNKALSDFKGDSIEESAYDGFMDYCISIYDVGEFKDLQGDTLKLSFSEDSQYDLTFLVHYDDGKKCYTFDYTDYDGYDDDWEDGVVIGVVEGDEHGFNLNNPDDWNSLFAAVSVFNELKGNITIVCYDENDNDIVFFNKDISDIADHEEDSDYENFTVYKISLSDLDDLDDFLNQEWFKIAFVEFDDVEGPIDVDSRKYEIDYDDNEKFVEFWEVDNDEDDGVIIWVASADEDYEFDVEDADDLNRFFAAVSVLNEFEGNITIVCYDEDDNDIVFFNKDISDIVNHEEDSDYENFTVYKISLSDLDDLDDFLNQEWFKIAFVEFDDEEGPIDLDSREYDIDYDEGIVKFWEVDEEGDDDDDRGEYIYAEFFSANTITNDVVVCISFNDLLLVDNEFSVFINDKKICLNLDDIDCNGEYYFIRVNDLLPALDDETYDIDIYVQFYTNGEASYYAEPDDEGLYIYVSPYISSEAYFFMDDVVISFTFENQDDEFKVTISKDGADDIVKTFKVSDFIDPDEDDDYPFYDITLSDLNITDAGEYHISVNFTKDGKELVFNEGNVTVGNVNIRYPDEEADNFTDVADDVATIRVPDDFEGFIELDLDGNKSEIPLSDLNYNYWPSDLGRQILLNDLKITEDGVHTLKLQVYDKDGNPLLDEPLKFDISVQTGENTVEFRDGSFGAEIVDVMEFRIGTPIPDDAYYIIYFNGKKAGNYTLGKGIVISDEFTVPIFDINLLKGGYYQVNVTYFDGENETDFGNGSFSIGELTLFSDKEVYPFGIGDVLISFNIDDPAKCEKFQAYFVYNWGPQGPEWSGVFPGPYSGNQILELYNGSAITFNPARFVDREDHPGYRLDLGTNYIYVKFKYKNGTELGGIISVEVVEPIDPELTISVTNVTKGQYPAITITTNKTFTGEVKVYIGNEVCPVNVVNGEGSANVTAILAPGTYDAIAVFEPVDLFGNSTKTAKFTIMTLPDPNLTISVEDITVGESAVVKVTTNTAFSGNVTVQIANKNYTVSVVNGTGSISVPGLAAGSYTATAFFAETGMFNASTKATTFKVNDKKADEIKLALKKVKVKRSAKKLILKATLKINGKAANKKVVIFKFNKKTYKAKTNKKGVAKVKIGKKVLRKLKVGKKVKIQASYAGIVKKLTVKVKK